MQVEATKAITSEALEPGGKTVPAKPGSGLPATGLTLAPPSMARAVINGEKTMFVKPRPVDIEAGDYLLLSQRNALGVVRVGQRKQITDKEFTELEPKHLVTAKLRAEWSQAQPSWKKAPLYVWPIEVAKKFDEPKETNVEPGPGIVAQNIEIKKADRDNFEKERDEVHKEWKASVNMTAAELKTWDENPASRLASVDADAVIERNLRLLETPREKWDEKDIEDAKRTIAFIARMKGVEQGEPAAKGAPSKRDISLRNWAFDPRKAGDKSAPAIGQKPLTDSVNKIQDPKTYDPSKVSDAVLRDDFRIALMWYANWKKDPKGFKYDLETIETPLRKILKEAVRRGPEVITFNPQGMKPSVRAFFLQVARDLKLPREMIKKIALKPDNDPEDMTDAELKAAHWQLHKMLDKEKKNQSGVKGWSTEDIVNLHARVVDEMFGRKIPHPAPPDNGLDELSADLEQNTTKQPDWHTKPAEKIEKRDYAVINRSGVKRGKEIKIEEVLQHLKTFKMRKPYIYLVGGLANHGKTDGDIDILVNDMEDAPEWQKSVIEFRLGRCLPPELAERMEVHYDRERGPFTNYCELFDLTVERVNEKNEVKEMRLEKGNTYGMPGSFSGKPAMGHDHNSHKLAFYKSVLSLARKGGTALEAFAGGGGSPVAKLSGRDHVAIEKDEALAKKYKKQHNGAEVINNNNVDALKELDLEDVTVADFDASASPFEAFDSWIARYKPKKYAVVTLTWGYLGHQVHSSLTREGAIKDIKSRIIKTSKAAGCAAKFLGWGYAPNRAVVYSAFSIVKNNGKHAELDKEIIPEGIVEKQQARSAPAKLRDQADKAEKNDKITLGEFFYQPKPTRAAQSEQLQTLENFMALYKERAEEWLPCWVQKKFDGCRHSICIDGDDVTIYSEDGDDNTDRFPQTIEELKALKVDKLVLDAEIERWDGRQHLPREAAAGYINSKDDPDDSSMVTNIFDVLYYGEDGDIHTKSATERLAVLKKLGIKQSTMGAPNLKYRLNAAPGIEVDDLEELERAVRRIRKLPGSEGVVCKQSETQYTLSTETQDTWIKYHNATTIGGIVTGREKTKGGVWVYQYGVLPGKEEPEETVEVDGTKVVQVGDTFATARDFSDSDGILIEAETVNIERSPKGLRISAWVPRVIGELDRKPDTVDQVARRAARNLVLQQKDVDEDGNVTYRPTRKRVVVEKQQDPYMEIPGENKTYRYTVQHHHRGASLHADLRLGLRPNKLLIGWTLNTQIAGAIKDPVTMLAEAKRLASKENINKISKINWHTGEWASRPKAGTDKLVRTSLLAERKAGEPWAWMDVEGKTKDPEPGEAPPVGGTRQYPGVFHIVDEGTVEWGSSKPWLHEYFFHGGALNYRMFFRLLEIKPRKTEKSCEACSKVTVGKTLGWADSEDSAELCGPCAAEFLEKQGVVLPPSEEQPFKDEAAWLAIYPDDQTPYVLDSDAVKKGWMPPDGVSALPKAIRGQIPDEYQYWKSTGAKAKERRDALVEAIKKKEIQVDVEEPYKSVQKASLLDADFVLQEQTWRGPVQVRIGPSRTRYWVRLDVGRKSLLTMDLRRNPLDNEEITTKVDWDRRKGSMKLEGDIGPGHYLNPTKQTPSFIEVLDKGKAEITGLSDDFIKIRFKGKKLKGLIGIKRSNAEWLWSASDPAPKIEGATKRYEFRLNLPVDVIEVKKDSEGNELRLVTSVALRPDKPDGQDDWISKEAIRETAHEFVANYNKESEIGYMHEEFGNNGLELVESWIPPWNCKIGPKNKKVDEGSWVVTIHVKDDAKWKDVKSGKVTGFSVGGVATVAAD